MFSRVEKLFFSARSLLGTRNFSPLLTQLIPLMFAGFNKLNNIQLNGGGGGRKTECNGGGGRRNNSYHQAKETLIWRAMEVGGLQFSNNTRKLKE